MAVGRLEVTLAALIVATISPAWCSPNNDPTDDHAGCSITKLDECLNEMDVTSEPLGRQVIPNLMANEFQYLCSNWETAQTCMKNVDTTCVASNLTNTVVHLEITQRIKEVNSGLEFICHSDLKPIYTEEARPCLEKNETELVNLEKLCGAEYGNSTWFLDKTNQENIYAFCKSAKTYLDCIQKGVTSICGEETARWTKEFHLTFWKPHLENIDCDPESSVDAGAAVIIALCTGAAIYCVICVVTAFVKDSPKCKRMCSKQKKDGKGEYAMQVQAGKDQDN